MIAYEELVTALNDWRARQGLPTTPVDYGDAGPTPHYADADASPNEVYDLSDDSGLIMTEDVAQAGEIGTMDEAAEVQPEYGDYGEYAQGGEYAEGGEYAQGGDYGEYSGDQPDVTDNEVQAVPETHDAGDELYDDIAGDDPYAAEQRADTMDVDEAGVIEEEPIGETLEAEEVDVLGEESAYDEPLPLDEPPVDDEAMEAGEPAADESDEPDELPDAPQPDDDEPRDE